MHPAGLYPRAHVRRRAYSTTRNAVFRTMMLISRCVVFRRRLRGNEIQLVSENDEIPPRCHQSPFQSCSDQSTTGHFISSIPLVSVEQFGPLRFASHCFEMFIERNTNKQKYKFCCINYITWVEIYQLMLSLHLVFDIRVIYLVKIQQMIVSLKLQIIKPVNRHFSEQ